MKKILYLFLLLNSGVFAQTGGGFTPPANIQEALDSANNRWSIFGNSGTNPATNFLGTKDQNPLIIKTNNNEMINIGFADIELGNNINSSTNVNIYGNNVSKNNVTVANDVGVSYAQFSANMPSHSLFFTATGVGYNGFSGSANTSLITSIGSPLILQAFGGVSPVIDFRIGNGFQAMRIANNRNIGIGQLATSPVQQLDVRSFVNLLPNTTGSAKDGTLRIENQSSNIVLDAGAFTTATWLQSRNRTDYSIKTPLLINPNGGNVAIGSTVIPLVNLDITGSVKYTTRVVTATGTLNATDNIVIVQNGATNITITIPTTLYYVSISRGVGSTGSITIQASGGQIMSLNRTIGATTSLALAGINGDSAEFVRHPIITTQLNRK